MDPVAGQVPPGHIAPHERLVMISDRPPGKSQIADGRHTLRKLSRCAEADPDALNVTLFRGTTGDARGWFIGPLAVVEGRATLPYLPQCDETNAAVAVVRAIKAAQAVGCPVCVIDPDDLWEKVWRV